MGLSPVVSSLLVGLAGWITYEWHLFRSTKRRLAGIPTVGSDTFILAYFSAWKFIFHGRKMIQQGYDKYPKGFFKVYTLETSSRWLVAVSDSALMKDVNGADEAVLSINEFGRDLLQSQHLLGKYDGLEPYHINTIRTGLTRSLSGRFADMYDEIEKSFNDILPATDGWTSYSIAYSILPIVTRTTNRIFVGQPLCQNTEYLKIQQGFAARVMIAAAIVNLFPGFLRGLVGRAITTVPTTMKSIEIFLGNEISERLERDETFGKKWEGRPNDLISWLLDYAPAKFRHVQDVIFRIILVNFAAIHTTSITLSNALLELAARPEYIEPLRKEVEEVIEQYGWTKEAMLKLRKLDSFIKETARITSSTAITMGRKAIKDFTLSNGVVIPAGVTVAAPSASLHEDPALYDGSVEFNGFRSSDKRAKEGPEDDEFEKFRHQIVTPSRDHLLFGDGKHACPGRFFAVNEVKCMVAYVVLNYDIQLPEGPNSPATWVGTQRILSHGAQVLLRKRQVV